jgi:hypothetical protein
MDTIWPMILAVMVGNLLTAAFLYGFARAMKIRNEKFPPGMVACLLVPLAVMAAGFFIYG